jgi:hypothetical protein
MASTYATRTVGTATNNNKFTISVWSKRSKLTGDYQGILTSRGSGWDAGIGLYWGNDESVWYNFSTSSTALDTVSTTAKYRDVNGWYHIVIAGDTTQSGTNKLKIWVNGEQQTSFTNDDRSSFVGLSNDLGHTGYPMQLGRKHDGSYYYDGSMSHMHFIDGTAYDATAFGSTDSVTGEWKINTSPSVTYGNNGFFILKDGNSVTDQSGNSNNFTVAGGTLTKTEDCPSSVFATWYSDSFDKGNQVSFSNGNTTTADAGGTSDYDPKAWTTLAANAGKYYCEMKLTAFATGRSYRAGVWFTEGNFSHESNANCFSGVKYTTTGNAVTIYSFGSDVQSGLTSFSAGDILGIAVDIDNGTIQYYRNGATYGSQITGLSSNFSGKSMMFCHTGEAGAGRTYTVNANFGNGYFGTTAVSSAGTNASNNGIFEYDVPTGFTALSTKGLNL